MLQLRGGDGQVLEGNEIAGVLCGAIQQARQPHGVVEVFINRQQHRLVTRELIAAAIQHRLGGFDQLGRVERIVEFGNYTICQTQILLHVGSFFFQFLKLKITRVIGLALDQFGFDARDAFTIIRQMLFNAIGQFLHFV